MNRLQKHGADYQKNRFLVELIFILLLLQAAVFAQSSGCDTTLGAASGQEGSPDFPVRTLVKADERFSALRSEILDRVRKGDFPSVSVGVFKDGRVVWEESFGWADKENRIAATPCTPYGLASMGKSVTAAAILVLVSRGMIDLEAPVSKYLDDLSVTVYEGRPEQVTIRRLLNMTAEIPHGNATFHDEKQARQYSAGLIKNRGIVVFPPGEVYLYSNFSFAVLERVIEKVSGKSYPEFLAAEVFAPLGMTNSFVGVGKHGQMIPAAERYASNGTRLAPRYPVPESSLAMYSSIDGLLNYAQFHLNVPQFKGRRIFDSRFLEQMHRLRGEAPHSNLALGIGSGNLDNKRTMLLTNGNAGGIQSTLIMIPEDGLAVICLVNSNRLLSDELAFRMTDRLAPGFLDYINTQIGNYEKWEHSPYQPTKELLGEWKGFVETRNGQVAFTMLFQPDGDVHVKVGDQLETILTDVSWRGGLLSGEFTGEIQMEESAGRPTTFTISLLAKENRLSGYVSSNFTNEKGSFSLGTYVRLLKSTADSSTAK